ncbi:hypothetical protein FQA39_LY07605 [Lamprigera yunnana]|nr:hypothetical protein FQA39_LY07605 [Lamprigera yunnana]
MGDVEVSVLKVPIAKSSTILQCVIVSCASLLSINGGLNFGWPSPSVLQLLSEESEFDITNEQVSYVVMLSPIAVCIGSPISGALMNKVGRKNSLLILAIIQLSSWVCIAASSYVPLLFVGRILAGISDGAIVTSVPVYICEILQPELRGYIGSIPTFGICLGSLFMNIYGSFTSIRMSACVSITFPVLFIALFATIPESPYYLLMNNREKDARSALMKLRNTKEIESELFQISLDIRRQISEPGRIKDVFTIKSNLKAFLILLCVRVVQHLSGLTALNFYTHFIFQSVDDSFSAETSAIICSVIKIVAVAIGTMLLERSGRRCLLLWSCIGSGVSLTLLGLYFSFQENLHHFPFITCLPIVMMLTYFVVNSMGLLTVPNLMMGELLSVKVKALVLSFVNICGGIVAGVSSKSFQLLHHNFGIHMPFYVFAGFSFGGFIMIYFCVPETRGKTLEEIQQLLKNKRKASFKEPTVSCITTL